MGYIRVEGLLRSTNATKSTFDFFVVSYECLGLGFLYLGF